MLGESVHRKIYIGLLILLGGTMVTSTWAANLAWVLLGVNWLTEGQWREKWQRARNAKLLHAILALVALHVVGMLWTSDIHAGLRVLEGLLPMLVVPVVALTSRPVRGRAQSIVLMLYCATVVVVSVIGAVRLWVLPDIPYRNAVPYISHIRFGLNCCMVIFLCVAAVRKGIVRWKQAVAVLLAGWLLVFLLLIRSYTSLSILLIVYTVIVFAYRHRWYNYAVWGMVIGLLAVIVGCEVRGYYRLSPQSVAPLVATTPNGRPYTHANDGLVENGNYINNYICREELEQEWNKRSDMALLSATPNGYAVLPTLVRYLNGLGLTKDSVGVSQLTDRQVKEIERGIANPVYEHAPPLKKMVYVMLFEHESRKHNHSVKNFTMLQRYEYWAATLEIIGRHPVIGVGTGDVQNELRAQLRARGSELNTPRPGVHSQYLSLLAAFGVLGVGVLIFFFGRAWLIGRCIKPVWLAWMLTVLISCLTECTIGTLAGILFCTYFLPFIESDVRVSHSE